MFHAVLPSSCPQSLSLLNCPHLKLLLQFLVLFIQHPKIYLCPLFTAFGLSTEHKWAFHGMKSCRHSHWLTSCCQREISWVPRAAPSFLLPSSHLSDLLVSEISAQPSLFDTHFISLECVGEKYKPTCSFFLRKTTHKEECACLASLYTGQGEPTEVRTWWRIGGVWCSK